MSSKKSDSIGGFTVKKEHIDYPYPVAASSPMTTKHMGMYPSPKPATKYEDFFNDENVNLGNYVKAEYNDSFLYNSPMQKKVKNNFAISPNMIAMDEIKQENRPTNRSGQKMGSDWFKNPKTTAFNSYGKDIFANNSNFYSPINVKYESPSKY